MISLLQAAQAGAQDAAKALGSKYDAHMEVAVLLEKIVHGKPPAEARMVDPQTRVTRDNVDEYAKNRDRRLGKK